MSLREKIKSIEKWTWLDMVIMVFTVVTSIFCIEGCIYTIQSDMWCKLGRDLLEDFGNINKETISWAYDAGLADIWVNHEFLTCMMMGACSYVKNYLFAVLCYIAFMIIIAVEFIRNVKENRGGNLVFYILTAVIFSKFATSTGFARPSAMSVLIYLLFILCIYDIFNNGWDRKRNAKLILLLDLWACCHGGSYPISIVTIIAFAIEEFVNNKKLNNAIKVFITYTVSTGILLIIPITRRSILYNFIQHGNTEEVGEWNNILNLIPKHNTFVLIVLIIVSLCTIVLQFQLHRVRNWKPFLKNCALWIMLGGTLVMGCLHIRYLQYFGCIGLMLIPKYVKQYERIGVKMENIMRIAVVAYSLLCTFYSDYNILNQPTNAEILLERQAVDRISYEDEYIEEILKHKDVRLVNLEPAIDDILVNNGIKVFHDCRCDNMYKQPYHDIFILSKMGNENEVAEALGRLRGYSVEMINMWVRNDDTNMGNIEWIKEKIGGDVEIVAISGDENDRVRAFLLHLK